jgi:imidazolonepropionase-like amidohydrolase
MFDGTQFHEPGVAVVRVDRIVSLNAGDAGSDAELIELGSSTVLPGFLDCHTHIRAYVTSKDVQTATDPKSLFWADSLPEAAAMTVRNAQTILANGFAMIRNVGAEFGLDLGHTRRHRSPPL